MKPQNGKYFFTRFYNKWAVYQYKDVVNEHCYMGVHIQTCETPIEARDITWKLNGWGVAKFTPDWMLKF